MSVIMTSTCMLRSKARYSAAVRAIRGVAIRSIAESDARFMKSTVLSIAPVFLKSEMKKSASSKVIPTAAKTTANFSLVPRTFACLAICAARFACGSPEPEKIGSYCPLTSVLRPSIVETPV